MKRNKLSYRIILFASMLLIWGFSQAQNTMNFINKSTGDTLLIIKDDGKVGIGTTSPSVELDLRSKTMDNVAGINLGNIDDSRWLWINGGRDGNPDWGPGIYWQGAYPLRFVTHNGQYNELMRLTGTGRLGLGTVDPQAGLHIVGADHPNSFIYLEAETDGDAGMRFYEGTIPKWHIYNNAELGGLQILRQGYLPVLFADQSTGYVGIGTITPTAKLEVVGTIRSSGVEGKIDGGFIFPDGTVQTSAYNGGPIVNNTLDQAYDQGGPGAGRIINADNGPVSISGAGGLQVDAPISSYSSLNSSGAGMEGGQVALYDGDTAGVWIIDNMGSSDQESFRVFRAAGYNPIFNALVINEKGNVGLGTATPREKLEVTDTIYSSLGGFKFPDATIQTTSAGDGSGNTLDAAYDEGGPGNGRMINADAGAFEVTGDDGVLFEGTYGSGTIPAEGEGVRMMWYPAKVAFRVGRVDGNGSTYWNDSKIGINSFASGYNTLALGDFSTSMGYWCTAYGNNATALGEHAGAWGDTSIAIGLNTHASGDNSLALGYNTEANGKNATAMGYFTIAQHQFSTALGNGTIAGGEYSMAMGWATKATNIYSTAMGFGTRANGESATAIGKETFSDGLASTAMGNQSQALGDYSTALGELTLADSLCSTASGFKTKALGAYSTAFGHETEASGHASIALGSRALASGHSSTAIGRYVEATGDYSTAIGGHLWANGAETVARGDKAIAIGHSARAKADKSIAMGYGAVTISDGSMAITDISFFLLSKFGLNRFHSRFSNGYYFYTDSSSTIGVFLSPGGSSWASISDSTKKENFRPAIGEEILSKITTFNLYTWNYKGQNPKSSRHYGPMAQDFYAAFGRDEMGSIGCETSIVSADFDGIIFIAIQALSKRTQSLKSTSKSLVTEAEILKSRLEKLDNQLSKIDQFQTSSVYENQSKSEINN